MFTDKERQIYTAAKSNKTFDPMALNRSMTIHTNGQLHDLVTKFNDYGDPVPQAQAEEKLVYATRMTFNLTPFTEKGGVCDKDVLEYLAHYLEWLSTPLKPTISLSLTGSQCSDCPPIVR